jgi:sirohydrochlorin cobaltochelatase
MLPSCLRLFFATLLCVLGCAVDRPTTQNAAPPEPETKRDDFGVLVMAHGGPPEWNAAVLDAVKPLQAKQPVEVAFGMADAISIRDAVAELERAGVRRIAVVRLFVSGSSWLERTEQILGVRPGAPAHDPAAHTEAHGGHSMAFFRVESAAAFTMSTAGLAEADEMGPILADRAKALSKDPGKEDVLVLAHGPGDDTENEQWLAQIDARAESIRAAAPFRRVEVATLREDWPEERKVAEQQIRAFVERAKAEGGRAIVIPFRVHGFGPYADVLQGLEYSSSGEGLLPHPNVTTWIDRQVTSLRDGPFRPPIASAQ